MKKIKVWDLPTLEERVEIRALPRALCVAITADGSSVFAGSSDLVQRWRVEPRTPN